MCADEQEWPNSALDWMEQNGWMFECKKCKRSVKWTQVSGPTSGRIRGRWGGDSEIRALERAFGTKPVTFQMGFEVHF